MATITCINCGINGEIEVSGLKGDISSTRIFRYLGHNPLSGHMHYQCPACSIVLLIEPQKILMNMVDLTLLQPTLQKKTALGKNAKSIQWLSLLKFIFRNKYKADLSA